MTSLFSYLITFFGIMFWVLRAIIAAMESLGKPFFCTTLNLNIEIAILFATLPCMLLVVKRSMIGAALYLGIYGSYFGTALFNTLKGINGEQGLTINSSMSLLLSVLGILIPLLTFFDILLNKNRRNISLDKQTAWYYKNEKFDREYDERADRNQYKIK